VKTTLEIQDTLLDRAKRLSKRTGKPLRQLVEQGLELVLESESDRGARYQLPDRSVGRAGAPNPLEGWSWQDLRDEIYAEPKE
jgi:hypothetical protein